MTPPSEYGTLQSFENCAKITTLYMDEYVMPWIYGNIFAGVLYGAIVLIMIGYLRILAIHVKGKQPLSTQQQIISIYVVVAFFLSTLQFGGAFLATTKDVYKFGCIHENITWTVDIIIMWRFFVIYHDLKHTKWSIFVCSSLVQAASIVTGIYTVIIMSDSTGLTIAEFARHNANIYLVVFEAVTLFQNIMLTTLIVGRLLLCRRRIRKVLGRCHGNEYTSIASMVVESQLLLGIAQVTMLVSLIQANAALFVYGPTFYQVTGQIQVLSPMVLIYRVMQGKMCNSKTIAQITRLKFNYNDVQEPKSAA
ncbi:hypothetical protein BDQ17DRAFT_1424828 [Cyathus striatus]|nr:hypothetical protein BDQ17DRAFT_1424828 [Cyathus striatus]